MNRTIDYNLVLKLRNEGKTSNEIADIVKCGGNHINKILRERFGLKILDVYFKRNKKYSVNSNFFDKKTNESLYILGLFYADGNIATKQYHCSLRLAEKDKLILQKITDIIQPSKPLYFIKSKNIKHQNTYSLIINDLTIRNSLIKLGCVPNKTRNIKWPNIDMDNDEVRHFIRGHFDGDGCIYHKDGNPSDCCICIVGYKDLIFKMFEKLKEILNINLSIKETKSKDIYSIYIYGGKQVEKFCDFIYKDKKDLFIDRKYQKYLSIKNRVDRRKREIING